MYIGIPSPCPVPVVGGRDVERQELTEGVDGNVNLAALVALGPVPALGWADRRSPIRISSRKSAIIAPKASDIRRQPVPGLAGKPLTTGAVMGHEAQAVEEHMRGVLALRGIPPHEGEIGRERRPFLIRDIPWIAGAGCRVHTVKV